MTNQQIFNKVVRHVRKQGRPSYDAKTNSCRYRMKVGETMLMCGIGCLVPDKEYVPQMDDCGISDIGFAVAELVNEESLVGGIDAPHIPSLVSKKRNLKLMIALQDAHDFAAAEAMFSQMQTDGKDHNSAFIEHFNKRIKYIARQFRLKQI